MSREEWLRMLRERKKWEGLEMTRYRSFQCNWREENPLGDSMKWSFSIGLSQKVEKLVGSEVNRMERL